MERKTEIDKILAMILILLLPLIIEQSCQYLPDNPICVAEKPFIEFPEPLKADFYQVSTSIWFSSASTVTASGTSTYFSSTTTT